MRRLLRIVFNTLTALSLGMAGIVCVVTALSYWSDFSLIGTTTWFGRNATGVEGESLPAGDEFVIEFSGGRFAATFREQIGDVLNSSSFDVGPNVSDERLPWIWHGSNGADSQTIIHGIFVVPLLAAVPAYRISIWLRRRRGPGLCPTCGYDLRASPERCPECGTVANASA